jgi:1-acyl-sn-glycerol-3-phosphate acyltransferase
MAARLMANARLVLRLIVIACLVPVSFVEAVFLAVLNVLSPRLRRRAQPAMMRAWCGWLARLWGVRIEVHGVPAAAPVMLASNHRSWLDIIVLGATLPGAFVSKAEIDRWPLVGYLARHGGRTLYINRGELRSFKSLGGNLAARLKEGERVIFFPEGTVSGERLLLRYRPRLFAAAIGACCPVQAVALDYHDDDGGAMAPMNAGDKSGYHALKLLRCRRIGVTLTFFESLDVADQDEKSLARVTQSQAATRLFSRALPGCAHLSGYTRRTRSRGKRI